jgi:hypothetical protein
MRAERGMLCDFMLIETKGGVLDFRLALTLLPLQKAPRCELHITPGNSLNTLA